MVNKVDIWVQTKRKYKDQSTIPSKKYKKVPSSKKPYFPDSMVYILNMDIIDSAIFYKKQEFNPLLLNMTDWNVPGGAVAFGSGAQEEECFRRSNYHKHLTKEYYPMGDIDAVYSKNVEYYRHGPGQLYKIMDNPVNLDMVASPAIRHPQLTEDCQMFEIDSDVFLMREKIRMLLAIGVENNHDVIVLSAWGCGVFGCPPIHMAKLFRSVIEEEFSSCYRGIVFAILDEKTYSIYNDVFGC